MPLTREEVRKTALLSRLELTDDEIDSQLGPLNDLLARFETLQAIDVTGIEPTSHSIPMVNVLRDDTIRPSLSREELFANAPQSRDGYFLVPRIIGE